MAQNINKENYFNEAYAKNPKAVQEFCDFIDEYKKEVAWNDLFGVDVKFHDLPFDMQMGIIARFIKSKEPVMFTPSFEEVTAALNDLFKQV